MVDGILDIAVPHSTKLYYLRKSLTKSNRIHKDRGSNELSRNGSNITGVQIN